MSSIHHSWYQNYTDYNGTEIFKNIINNQKDYQKNLLAETYQHNLIPVYNIKNSLESHDNHKVIYNDFFYGSGCFIVKGIYDETTMTNFNRFCESTLQDTNFTHPIQENKLLIKNLLYRLSNYDSNLLVNIFSNQKITTIADILLGFGVYGSVTGQLIKPGDKKQQSHVDHPLNLFSSPFWNDDINKFKRYLTHRQMNIVLPYHSVQVLVASDKMDVINGSTEIIPCSQNIDNIDIKVYDKELNTLLDTKFVNVSLEKGDVLFFNRRLVQRGGENLSNKRRNSLIIQYVNLFAVPQEIYDYEKVLENISDCFVYNTLSDNQQEEFLYRLKQPFQK